MLCQKCHKNRATTRYAEVVDGKVTDLRLCEECLSTHQNAAATGFDLSSVTPAVRRSAEPITLNDSGAFHLTCQACGTEIAQVFQTGAVSCALCYDAFAEPMKSILRNLHGGLIHRGKAAHVDDRRARVRGDMRAKRALLKASLRMENYEEAAVLRDEIRSLEAGLSGLASDND